MVRYRELRTIAQLEKNFPFVVEVPVPPKGLGRKLDQIELWISTRATRNDYGRWGRFRSGVDIAVWAFKEPSIAEAFKKMIQGL